MKRRVALIVLASLVGILCSLSVPGEVAANADWRLPALNASPTDLYIPGKFVWFDLVTDDLAATQRFYGAVFGWGFRPVEGAPESYLAIENGGLAIGGVFFHKMRNGSAKGGRWIAMMSVENIHRAVRYVGQNGGTVVVPPRTVAGRGTYALCRDPEGALFGLLTSETGDPEDGPVHPMDFFWMDLLARQPETEAQFYRGLAGYEVSTEPLGPGGIRVMLASAGYARAGIVLLPPSVNEPGWLPYVLVDDVAAVLRKVAQEGGAVLLAPRPELLDGNLAVIADPRGGVLGIVKWEEPPEEGGAR
jgi:predicted enzyme related to lactoylglutathione lyase